MDLIMNKKYKFKKRNFYFHKYMEFISKFINSLFQNKMKFNKFNNPLSDRRG